MCAELFQPIRILSEVQQYDGLNNVSINFIIFTCIWQFFVLVQNSEENIAEKCNKESELLSSTDWENVTAEDCDWNILISQLEDITFLDSALK